MNLNVFYWSFRKRYYLLHPWKWVEDLFDNLKAAYQRAVRGYADRDLFSWDNWFLTIAPAMLLDIAACKNGGYPGIEPFETPEKWEKWLRSIAFRLTALQDDWAEEGNEYEEPYFAMIEKRRHEENKDVTDEELNALHDKWMNEMLRLRKQQDEETKAVFNELAEHLYQIWI